MEQRILETERLNIRVETQEDYAHTFATRSVEQIMDYYGLVTEADVESQRRKILGGMTTYRTAVMFFHLQDRQMGKVVGSFAYHNWYPMHSRSEIGYDIKKEEYKNKGYMGEALPAIIAYGFEQMGLNRMEAFIHPDNTPSRKLVERRGFHLEAHLKDHFCADGVIGDSLIYRLLKQEYNMNNI